MTNAKSLKYNGVKIEMVGLIDRGDSNCILRLVLFTNLASKAVQDILVPGHEKMIEYTCQRCGASFRAADNDEVKG